jgi:hypothetical protein
MSLGFPARTAVVCAIACASGAVRADDEPVERRKVAVVALSKDPDAAKLKDDLYNVLVGHWALQPTGVAEFDRVLFGPFLDEDGASIEAATARRTSAQTAIDNVAYADAVTAAHAGLDALTGVTPAKAAPLAADLAFSYGAAEMSAKRAASSARWFQLVHRLDPQRKLDPIHIDPDTTAAYEKAIVAKLAMRKLEVSGIGEVWIDGTKRGEAPGSFDVDDGEHLVQLAGNAREVRGTLANIDKDQALKIADAPASQDRLVARARLALRDTPDDAVARAPAMRHLAELLDVHDAVLIWKSSTGKLLVQTWRDRAPGFSALKEYIEDEPPIDILEPLAAPKPPKIEVHDTFRPPPPPFVPPNIEPEPPWYRKTWVQASVAGGVIAAVVGTILWVRHTGHVSVNPNGQWEGM